MNGHSWTSWKKLDPETRGRNSKEGTQEVDSQKMARRTHPQEHLGRAGSQGLSWTTSVSLLMLPLLYKMENYSGNLKGEVPEMGWGPHPMRALLQRLQTMFVEFPVPSWLALEEPGHCVCQGVSTCLRGRAGQAETECYMRSLRVCNCVCTQGYLCALEEMAPRVWPCLSGIYRPFV